MPGGTTRRDGWSDWELQILYDLVHDEDWYEEARPHLLARTENAIRQRMTMLRKEAGIIPQRRGGKAMSERNANRKRAVIGSEKLRKALEALEAA